MRVNRAVIRPYRVSGADTPEDRVNDEAGIPGHTFAIGNPTAFGPKTRADQRLCFSTRACHCHHEVAALRIVRRTTASKMGTLYAFFESGLDPATAA